MNTNTTTTTASALPITERFIAWTTNQPDETCRRWSYEIEASGLGGASMELQQLGFDTHNDPSVTDADCSCSCDQCDHSCDCDNCSITNGWDEPSHCSECSDTEAAPSQFHPVITTHDTDRLPRAMRAIRAVAEIDETCGGHIHINAYDLNAQQVASVMRMWSAVERLLPDLIGRESNTYATSMEERDIERILSEYPDAERYRAVNALNWVNGRQTDRKATLEFRQFAGTLDEQVIVARGYLCRALVEHAKANRPIYWVVTATAPEALLRELGLGYIA